MEYQYLEYFQHRLDRLAENIKQLESSLKINEEKYLLKHQPAITDNDGGLTEKEQISHDFFEDDVALYDESRQFYRQSSFLMLFAFLEDSLQKICSLLKAEFNYNLEPKDLNGKGVMQLQKYLEKIAFIDLDEDLWKKVDDYRLVRNHLAHEYGELAKESKKKIISIVDNDEQLNVDDWGYTGFIRIGDEYLNQFIDLMTQIFSAIDKLANKKLKIRLVSSDD